MDSAEASSASNHPLLLHEMHWIIGKHLMSLVDDLNDVQACHLNDVQACHFSL